MKTLKFYLIVTLVTISFLSIDVKGQIKVSNTGLVTMSNHTLISGAINSDALDIINSTTDLPSSYDLIWGYYSGSQSNNAGLLHLQTAQGVHFIVKSNGNVGIGTYNPSYKLDVPNGIVRFGNATFGSDERLKSNIQPIKGALSSLANLKGKTYHLKPSPYSDIATSKHNNYVMSYKDSIQSKLPKQEVDSTLYNRNHIGFLAQDIQKVFPELVYADKDGILSVDYISLIPILVESVKELNNKNLTDSLNCEKRMVQLRNQISTDSLYFENKLKALANQLNKCCGKSIKSAQSDNESDPIEAAALSQNTPNPFNQNTSISYYLPSNIGQAMINIYNMQGAQIKSISITDRGNGKVIINGNELTAGMYIYALIVDGKEIDTKRMILTQ
jgi:hypothetical protein